MTETPEAKLAFEAVLLCDDVRTEENGKSIIIGVYSHDFYVRELPIEIELIVHCRGDVLEPGIFKNILHIVDSDGIVLFKSGGKRTPEFSLGSFTLSMRVSFTAIKETELHFITVYEDRSETLIKARVHLADRTATDDWGFDENNR